jgi:hypothetical protein
MNPILFCYFYHREIKPTFSRALGTCGTDVKSYVGWESEQVLWM